MVEGEVGPGKVTQRMKEIFGDMDRNGDGHISHSEFKRAMSQMRVRGSLASVVWPNQTNGIEFINFSLNNI